MNRNRKRTVNPNFIWKEGGYTIREAVPADAVRYIDRFNYPITERLRNDIVKEREEIKEFQKSLSNFCFAIIREIDGKDVLVGLIETKEKPKTYGCEAYVRFFFNSVKDQMKEKEVGEIFIHLLKEVQLYDKIYICTTDSYPFSIKEVQIA